MNATPWKNWYVRQLVVVACACNKQEWDERREAIRYKRRLHLLLSVRLAVTLTFVSAQHDVFPTTHIVFDDSRWLLSLSISYPKGNNDEEHLEEDAEDHVVREGQRHDAQKRGRGTDHNRGADLPQSVGDTRIFGYARVLSCTEVSEPGSGGGRREQDREQLRKVTEGAQGSPTKYFNQL